MFSAALLLVKIRVAPLWYDVDTRQFLRNGRGEAKPVLLRYSVVASNEQLDHPPLYVECHHMALAKPRVLPVHKQHYQPSLFSIS